MEHNTKDLNIKDSRNIRDVLKFLPVEKIKERYLEKPNPFGILLANIEYDINIGGIVRTANNFRARQVFYYGRRKYNRVGALGSYLYMDIQYLPGIEGLLKSTRDYTWVGVEQHNESTPLFEYQWPENPLLVFGNESTGFDLCPEVAHNVEHWVEIPSLGTIRSLNVAACAAITMYDYLYKKNICHDISSTP